MTHLAIALLMATALQSAPARRTATIEGVVMGADSNEPLARAQVLISRVVPSGTQAQAAAPIMPVLTESDGKFTFKDIPAGSYRLLAMRNGYSRQEYGQRSPRIPGTVVTVQAGQNLKDISFRLTPAGSVSGRVIDPTGEPVAGLVVQLMRPAYTANGKQVLSNVVTAPTNDRGEYRLYWITPGTYYLSVSPAGTYLQTFVQNQSSITTNVSRGQSNAAAANATATALVPLLGLNANEVMPQDLAVTYYPGTADRLKAMPISVQAGSEFRVPDIGLIQQKTFRVRGRVFDTRKKQQPLQAVVQMVAKETLGMTVPRNGNYETSTGTFEFGDVAPGEYIVVAVTQSAIEPAAVTQTTINVSGNVDDLVLNVRAGFAVSGKIKVEGAKPLTAAEMSRMKVGLLTAVEGIVNAGQPAAVKPDGAFTLENVSPADYRVAMVGLPANAYIKEARFGSTNALEANAAITESTTDAFEITISRNGGQVTGKVIDSNSKPAATTQVVLIPDTQRDRRELFKTQVTDQAGKFTFQGIPPGDYKIFAWEDLEPYAFMDAQILKQYESQGKAVKIAEQSQEMIDVMLIR